jgi:hypothetical protein
MNMQHYKIFFMLFSSYVAGAASGSSGDVVAHHPISYVGKAEYIDPRIIRVSELKDFQKLHDGLLISNITPSGLLVDHDDERIYLKRIDDAGVIDVNHIAMPTIAEKKLYEAKIFSDRFVELRFGIPDNSKSIFSTELDDDQNIINHINTETHFWDCVNGDIFQILTPDFYANNVFIDDVVDPTRVLVCEISLKEGEFKGQYRYRYYNLVTREFHDAPVLDFHPIFTHLYFDIDDTGQYDFYRAVQMNLNSGFSEIKNVITASDGSLSMGDTISTMLSREIILTHTKDHMITKRIEGGFVVPYYTNFKAKRPVARPLLLDEEMDELLSNVYDCFIEEGVLAYKTHFDRAEFHVRDHIGAKITERGILLKKLHDYGSELFELSKKERVIKIFCDGTIRKTFEELRGLILPLGEGFTPYERALSERIFSEGFYDYLTQKLTRDIPLTKLVNNHSDVIPTADRRFRMPIYFTLPESIKSDGWFIVNVHGGPHWREFNDLNIEQQFWTSRGYPYLNLNIRGSTGFGSNYRLASDGHWYDTVDDIKSAIDWAKSNGFGTKAIVMGGSFGAYAAAGAYAKGYTDVAIAINGLYDLNLDLEGIREGRTKYSKYDLSDPLQQFGNTVEIRTRNSIIPHMTARPGKMLIIAGLKDDNCLPEQSELLFTTMKKLGNHAEFIKMADEGHSPSKHENLLMLMRVQETFLGDITGHAYESNGYATLLKTPGVSYGRTSKRNITSE